MKDRKQIDFKGHTFLVPHNDKECHPVVSRQVYDVDKAMQYCEGCDVVVQAGGNMGIWPFYLSEYFRHVYTFEPHPENFFCLVRNCPQENIYKFQAGLSDEPACFSMEGEDTNAGAYQMGSIGYLPAMRLDAFELPALDLLCLDIEGMELKALKGAHRHLQKFAPVIMLEDKGLSMKYGTQKGEVTKFLKTLGYELAEEIHRDLIFTSTWGPQG